MNRIKIVASSERHHTKQSTTITQKQREQQLFKRLLREKEKLLVNNKGVLIRRTAKVDQIAIPPSLKNLVYQELYEKMGHLGAERNNQLAKESFLWLGMEKDIKDYIGNNCICFSQRKRHVLPRTDLGTVKSSGPMEIVGIDFLKVDKCSGGYECILRNHIITSCIQSKKKSQLIRQIDILFYRLFGRVSSVHFQDLMMKKLSTSITISKSQLVTMVMFNLMIKKNVN